MVRRCHTSDALHIYGNIERQNLLVTFCCFSPVEILCSATSNMLLQRSSSAYLLALLPPVTALALSFSDKVGHSCMAKGPLPFREVLHGTVIRVPHKHNDHLFR